MKKVVQLIDVKRNIEKPKRDGSTYNCTTISYEDRGQVREQAFATTFLAKAHRLAGALAKVNAGDNVELTIEKKGDYWNVTDICLAGNAPAASASPSAPPKAHGGGDNRQDSIIFQNSMAHATNILIHNAGKSKVDVEEVIRLAKKIALVARDPKLDAVKSESPNNTSGGDDIILDDDVPFGDD